MVNRDNAMRMPPKVNDFICIIKVTKTRRTEKHQRYPTKNKIFIGNCREWAKRDVKMRRYKELNTNSKMLHVLF